MGSKNPPKNTLFAEPLCEHTLNMAKLYTLQEAALYINKCIKTARRIPRWNLYQRFKAGCYIAGMVTLANHIGDTEIDP